MKHSPLSLNIETILYFAPPQTGDAQRPAIEILGHPFSLQRDLQQSSAQRAAKMRPALTPVEAGTRELAAQRSRLIHVDAQRLQSLRALSRDLIGNAVADGTRRQPPHPPETVVQRHRQRSRHVIVAGSRRE